jgi:hypothetical protein
MAEKTATWTDLLSGLIRGFVLLRDVFGYILPGFVFLLIGIQSGRVPGFEEFCKICGVELPRWMAGILVLVTSYLAGHFVVATVFFPLDFGRLIKEKIHKKTSEEEKTSKEELDAQSQEASDLLRYRKRYPDIFIELDRRSILALLRTGLAGSVLLGLVTFYSLYPYRRSLVVAAGAIMLFSANGAYRHVKGMRKVTLKAAMDEEKGQ